MKETEFILFGHTTRTAHPTGRFEFRSWFDENPPAVGLLQRHWDLTGTEVRSDIYLLSSLSAFHMVKLRDGKQLEIKIRGADAPPLQYWRMPVSASFPLTEDDLLNLETALGLPTPLDHTAAASPAHLLACFAESALPLRITSVRKAKMLFRQGSCVAEIATIKHNGIRSLTVAIDDPDYQSALTAVEELGLVDYRNLSYGEALAPLSLPSFEPELRLNW